MQGCRVIRAFSLAVLLSTAGCVRTFEGGGGDGGTTPVVTPTLELISPSYGNGVVPIHAVFSDAVHVHSVFFRVDGQSIAELTAPYFYSWDSNNVSEGPHALDVIAGATSGELHSIVQQITIDRTAPFVVEETPAIRSNVCFRATPIGATVSENLNAATVNAGTVFLTDTSGNLVSSSVSYSSSTNQIKVTPAMTSPILKVLLHLTPGIRDLAENALVTPPPLELTLGLFQEPATPVPFTGTFFNTTLAFDPAGNPIIELLGYDGTRQGPGALRRSGGDWSFLGNSLLAFPTDQIVFHQTTLDESGAVLVVYTDRPFDGVAHAWRYGGFDGYQAWQELGNLGVSPPGTETRGPPSIAVGPDGAVYVSYPTVDGVEFRRYDRLTNQWPLVTIRVGANAGALRVDSWGRLVYVWPDYVLLHTDRFGASGWEDLGTIDPPGSPQVSPPQLIPAVAILGSSIEIVFETYAPSAVPQLFSRVYSGTAWGPVVWDSATHGPYAGWNAAFDPEGRILVATLNSEGVGLSVFHDGSWSRLGCPIPALSVDVWVHAPAPAFTADGRVGIAYGIGDNDLVYTETLEPVFQAP